MKSVKDGIDGLPNAVLSIANVIDRGAATSVLLRNHIKVPYKLNVCLLFCWHTTISTVASLRSPMSS